VAARSRRAPRPAPPPAPEIPDSEAPALKLNLAGGPLVSLVVGETGSFQRQALHWCYALRNRERWNTTSDAVGEQRRAMCELAAQLGLTAEHLTRIADAGLVEVDIPWTREEAGWELRIFPWEFLLAAATWEKRGRGKRSLAVVRHLRMPGRGALPRDGGAPKSWLQVISAPGRLAAEYDFESEKQLLELSVKASEGEFSPLEDPDEGTLGAEVARIQPDVIHLSGFDSHQGLELLQLDWEDKVWDGYILRSSEGIVQPVPAERLARLLTSAPDSKPRLVACNIYDSGARIAPLCVACGARAAIGFQDSFDDQVAELFFTALYVAWSLTDWDLVSAFRFGWQEISAQGRSLLGSGVLLWNERSIAEGVADTKAAIGDDRQAQIRKSRSDRSEAPTADTIRDVLDVEVEPIAQLNYSILHNNGPIFKRFRVRKKRVNVGGVDGILVGVGLHVGTDSYPFRLQVALEETTALVDLDDKIRISLASSLSRAIHESIHTSLFVEVSWQGVILYQKTHRVTLLPVDEWRFDISNYCWLPSFVLPRDPAVRHLVDAAQRYLMSLRDDATAGFDGYQAVDTVAGARTKIEDCAAVDLQVRAIWSALLYEAPLSYINPPPSFTESSQRLRSPSDCITGKRGTCIDLALLMASCLEYVDIYPAIFLLRTHAFPAYWRHDSFHRQFQVARSAATQSEEDLAGLQQSSSSGQTYAWAFEPSQYREILGEVQAGRLVPLETTLITGRGSFADAIAGGVQNLANRREFESMIDIRLARTDEKSSVTPLPIRRGEV
jgi:hypothetical protein